MNPTSPTKRMPAIFIGHGSPMNAIDDNDYTRAINRLGERLTASFGRPRAILCISAHWMSEGTWITHMERPKTIHDFYGLPQELFDVRYPAEGRPDIADEIIKAIPDPRINADREMWGLDHGAWSVLLHLYPKADVPVMQLSLYLEQPAEYHFKVGQAISGLRDRGILILASGNIVHNLPMIKWDRAAPSYDWAVEFDEWTKQRLETRDFSALTKDATSTPAGRLSVPTPEHYYPLLYVLGAARADDEMRFEYEGLQNASISMRAVSFGA